MNRHIYTNSTELLRKIKIVKWAIDNTPEQFNTEAIYKYRKALLIQLLRQLAFITKLETSCNVIQS